MRALLLLALVACGKGDRTAPMQTGSGSSTAPPTKVLPEGARCSGRWTGRIRWTTPNCSEATIADVAPFDVTINANGDAWDVSLAQPANAKLRGSFVTWDTSIPDCQVSLDYSVPLPKPRTAIVSIDLANGSSGPAAHARLDQSGLDKDACNAVGVGTLEFKPDDGRVPTLPARHRRFLGRYELEKAWVPGECALDRKAGPLAFELGVDAYDQLVVSGLLGRIDHLTPSDDGLTVTQVIDDGPLQDVLTYKLAVDMNKVSGSVELKILDGDLVTCTRTGTLRGDLRL